jgi:hypothetical protein
MKRHHARRHQNHALLSDDHDRIFDDGGFLCKHDSRRQCKRVITFQCPGGRAVFGALASWQDTGSILTLEWRVLPGPEKRVNDGFTGPTQRRWQPSRRRAWTHWSHVLLARAVYCWLAMSGHSCSVWQTCCLGKPEQTALSAEVLARRWPIPAASLARCLAAWSNVCHFNPNLAKICIIRAPDYNSEGVL